MECRELTYPIRLDAVEGKLKAVEAEGKEIGQKTKEARDAFLAVKKKRFVAVACLDYGEMLIDLSRCDLFNKAFNHIAEHIDEVYKNLTKGKAAPVGGVAYLSLEDSEVGFTTVPIGTTNLFTGTIPERNQVPRHAADETFPRHGPAFGRRKDDGGSCVAVCRPQLSAFSVLRAG